jgi:hypothetical protein
MTTETAMLRRQHLSKFETVCPYCKTLRQRSGSSLPPRSTLRPRADARLPPGRQPPPGNHPFPFGTRLASRAVVICLCRHENEVDAWGSCHEKNRCSYRRHVPSVSHFRSE